MARCYTYPARRLSLLQRGYLPDEHGPDARPDHQPHVFRLVCQHSRRYPAHPGSTDPFRLSYSDPYFARSGILRKYRSVPAFFRSPCVHFGVAATGRFSGRRQRPDPIVEIQRRGEGRYDLDIMVDLLDERTELLRHDLASHTQLRRQFTRSHGPFRRQQLEAFDLFGMTEIFIVALYDLLV